MSNHLKRETSPYLLQHAENPVEWYPWCEEAFDRAKREDKPIFLSIGYSTCHWCHVMAHESFENSGTAEFLNRYFISIKVDREERPDIDSVYMSVCQAFTGRGGWPMSIFMTWEKKPFFAGTYFPVQSQYGMPGFPDLLHAVAERWQSNRAALLASADEITGLLKQEPPAPKNAVTDRDVLKRAVEMFAAGFDREYGGFGAAPKFPMPHNLLFLMLYARQSGRPDVLEMAEKTLAQMQKGGIFDQIGGGFSRYSTDPYFLVPHFEKMLYDNALLIIAYTAAHAATGKHVYLDTAEKTAQYVLREMAAEGGGFYSAQDADSEGVEGKYYTFTREEVINVLGTETGERFSEAYDITPEGNFEGASIPNLIKSGAADSDFCDAREKLYRYRKKRFRLHMDDKLLLSWNSMMIAALAMLCRASGKTCYLEAAQRAQVFIEGNLRAGLHLYASWRDGKCSEKSFLDDYAWYTAALTELYHATLDRTYLTEAKRLCMETIKRFSDGGGEGFYLADLHDTELFVNPKESYDGAVPSGNSVMAYDLVRLYQLTGEEELGALAEKQLRYLSAGAAEDPMGHGMFLLAKQMYDNPPAHIVVALENASDMETVKKQLPFLANVVTVSGNEAYPLVNGLTTFYVCKGHTCLKPANTLEI